MARQSRTRRRLGRVLPWMLLAIPALAVPIAVILMTTGEDWTTDCASRFNSLRSFMGLSEYTCDHFRMTFMGLGAVGTFAVVALAWWLISELTGLMRIFEVPWFGIGEDVESVGVVESVVRAAIFVLFLWLGVGMSVLAWNGAVTKLSLFSSAKGKDAGAGKPPSSERRKDETRPSQNEHPTSPSDPSKVDVSLRPILEQTTELNTKLAEINKQLIKHDEHLVFLDRIHRKLADWDQATAARWSSTAASILQQTQQLDAKLDEANRELVQHEQHLAVLHLIYQALEDRSRGAAASDCFDAVTVNAGEPIVPARLAAGQPSPGERRERYRSVAARVVFFDIGRTELSPQARHDLGKFLAAWNGADSAVSVHGSADPQGSPDANKVLALQRTRTIEEFIRTNLPLLRLLKPTATINSGEPMSEPYQRVATIRILQSCQ